MGRGCYESINKGRVRFDLIIHGDSGRDCDICHRLYNIDNEGKLIEISGDLFDYVDTDMCICLDCLNTMNRLLSKFAKDIVLSTWKIDRKKQYRKRMENKSLTGSSK